jgi:hypothetical protein
LLSPGELIAASLGLVIGILLMWYLVSYNLLPEKFDASYVVVGCVALCVGAKLSFSKITGKKTTSSPEELTRKASALSQVIENPPEGRALPGHIRTDLEASFRLWTAQIITDKQFEDKIEGLQGQVREIYIPTLQERTPTGTARIGE